MRIPRTETWFCAGLLAIALGIGLTEELHHREAIYAGTVQSLPKDWGLEQSPVAFDLERHDAFLICYSRRSKTPVWVLERLTADSLKNHIARTNDFHADMLIPEVFRAELADYQGEAWDRGHNAPADDFTTEADEHSSFALSNMAPQNPTLNRGLWAQLEKWTRQQAIDNPASTVYVVTFTFSETDGANWFKQSTIGTSHVYCPAYFAKSVLRVTGNDYQLRSFVAQNAEPKAGATVDDLRVPTADLEKQAGIQLWPNIPAATKNRLALIK